MIAIDLGSNSCRVIQYCCAEKTTLSVFEKSVKTADGIEKDGKVSSSAIARVIDALLEAQKEINFTKQDIKAYTTAALRMADNSTEALNEIYQKTGVKFDIIDAKTEATLTHLAVKNRLIKISKNEDNAKSFALVDVGGGSCEVIFSQDDQVYTQSFNVGIVTITQRSKNSSEIASLIDEALSPVRDYIDSFYKEHFKPKNYISTAGTPTTVAAYILGMDYQNYDAQKINGFKLSTADLLKALDDLLNLSETERTRFVGVGREDLIITGILIIQKFYELLGFKESLVIDDGLREGIALQYCASVS